MIIIVAYNLINIIITKIMYYTYGKKEITIMYYTSERGFAFGV